MVIRGGRLLIDNANIFADTQGDVAGAGIGIDIEVREALALTNGTIRAVASSTGSGDAGTITIKAAGDVTLTDFFILNETFSSGAAGVVTITAADITLTASIIDTGTINRTNSGPGGTVTMMATGDVTLRDEALINSSSLFGTGNAGAVTIAAKTLSLTNGARITTDTSASGTGGTGGTIMVTATDMTLTDGAVISTETFGSRNAGDISLNVSRMRASTLEGQELVQVSSSSRQGAQGDAGTVAIQGVDGAGSVARKVALAGSQVLTQTAGFGKGGDINVRASEVTLANEAIISATATGSGTAGTITIGDVARLHSTNSRLTTEANEGQGGTIRIEAATAMEFNATAISATVISGDLISPLGTPVMLFSGVGGSEDNFTGTRLDDRAETPIEEGSPPFAGTFRPTEPLAQLIGEPASGTWILTIGDTASGDQGTLHHWSLELGGVAVQSRDVPQAIVDNSTSRSTLVVEAGPEAVVAAAEPLNKGGDINVTARSLAIRHGATLSASSTGTGPGGTVRVTATEAITIAGDKSAVLTRAAGRGRGGDITLHAGTIQLSEGAVISAQSSGEGNAGSIRLTATDTFLSKNSAVTTAAEAAGGGNLALEARLVRLIDSVLTAEAMGVDQQGSDGGNVTIQAGFVILDYSQMQANAFGGNGGNIDIEVEEAFLADTETCEDQACLDASSRLGVAGTVEVSNPTADLSGIVTPLPQTFTQATALLPQRCAERLQGQPVSTFVLAGRDSVPLQPGGALPSPLYRAEQEVAASPF